MNVLDFGCGVGGSMCNIVKVMGGKVIGIIINEY